MDILPEFDKNAAYIWACYIVGFSMLSLLGLYVHVKSRQAKAELTRIEEAMRETQAPKS